MIVIGFMDFRILRNVDFVDKMTNLLDDGVDVFHFHRLAGWEVIER